MTAGRIIRQNESSAGLRSIMRIGRAGENLVTYADVSTETYRHFGRLGMGAVFGSKKLKAVVVSGNRTLEVADKVAYRALYDEINTAAVSSPVMKKYHDLGTAENIQPLSALGGLPTRNAAGGTLRGRRGHLGGALCRELPRASPGLLSLPCGVHSHRRPARTLSG